MDSFTALLRHLTLEDFTGALQQAGRQAREAYFARHKIRAPKLGVGLRRMGDKNAARAQQLAERLRHEQDEPLAQELLRQFFLVRRPLLSKALDWLGIEHDDGLSSSAELSRFATMADQDADALVAALVTDKVEEESIARLYVQFMRLSMQQEDDDGHQHKHHG